MPESKNRIEKLRKAGLVLEEHPSRKVVERLASLSDSEVDALIDICRKISSPEANTRLAYDGFQIRL